MNKKGQVMIMSIIVGIMIFVSGMIFLNFIKIEVEDARNETLANGQMGYNCDNSTGLTAGEQITCLVIDSVIPYYIIIIVSFAGGVITDRLLI